MAADDSAAANGSAASEPSEASFSSDGDGPAPDRRPGDRADSPAERERCHGAGSPEPTACSESSGFSDDDSLHMDDGRGITLQELLQQLQDKGRRGLYDDYWEIKSRPPAGTFNQSM